MQSCSVVIPIGPGHQRIAQLALTSVMLAADEENNPFDEVYVVCGDDTKAERGRGSTRNQCACGPMRDWMAIIGKTEGNDQERAFNTDWIFFLDADDLMASKRIFGRSAFTAVAPYLDEYDAIWGAIYEVHPDNKVYKRSQVDHIKTYEAYLRLHPAQSCQMGHFVRRSAFVSFDETMPTGEDVKYYLRMWREHCCIKIAEPLFLNRRGMHTWALAENEALNLPHGRDWNNVTDALMKEARDEHEKRAR